MTADISHPNHMMELSEPIGDITSSAMFRAMVFSTKVTCFP